MNKSPLFRAITLGILGIYFFLSLAACGPSEVQFAVKHIRDQAGEQISEVLSYETNPGFDNSAGSAALQVQVQLSRNYRNQIIDRINSEGLSSQRVREKIVQLYKLSPNDPEGTTQKALCPLSVVIPSGTKGIISVEWTERWAEGVVNEGANGEGKQLGTYKVFLGYTEPCSLVKQENKK
jgi:hypothetical protein